MRRLSGVPTSLSSSSSVSTNAVAAERRRFAAEGLATAAVEAPCEPPWPPRPEALGSAGAILLPDSTPLAGGGGGACVWSPSYVASILFGSVADRST